MTYSVYQHWDPLKVCIIGRSYAPEFYSFVTNTRVRAVMEKIAYETEEDYQKLEKLLKSFNVEVLRPNVKTNWEDAVRYDGKIEKPPMTPRDYTATIADTFYIDLHDWYKKYDSIKGQDWPELPLKNVNNFSKDVIRELEENYDSCHLYNDKTYEYNSIVEQISKNMKVEIDRLVNTSYVTRIGKDIYVSDPDRSIINYNQFKQYHNDMRFHNVNTEGHADGNFCPVCPGLVISLHDVQNYKKTFPGWEVIYLPEQSWHAVRQFRVLKEKNRGKWWVPGEELNDEFTDFVESWLNHWVGYVEETVFDVNMLVIDEKNVVCNNYNEKVFRAFERYGITPHVINFRHRYFWDGGLHCITSDVHREGTMKDYFPERG